MFRDTQKELARLEAELLAEELPEGSGSQEEWDTYEEDHGNQPRYRVYNTDASDEDLDEYTEAVLSAERKGTPGILVLLIFLLTIGLVALVIAFLRREGIL